MAGFIDEVPQKPSQIADSLEEGWWILHMDWASRALRSKIGLLLQSPIGEQLEQAIQLGFLVSNNEAEYEVILVGLNLPSFYQQLNWKYAVILS